MKEEDRLIIVDIINGIKNIYNMLNEKLHERNNLLQDEKVKKYIQLEDEIIKLEKYLSENHLNLEDTETKVVNSIFSLNTFYNPSCEHDTWIYVGSYFLAPDYINKGVWECNCENENVEEFEYNKYQCLDCKKNVKVKDYKKFEQEHVVLKKINDVSFKSEYFHLLMENTAEETQKILINKYGKK